MEKFESFLPRLSNRRLLEGAKVNYDMTFLEMQNGTEEHDVLEPFFPPNIKYTFLPPSLSFFKKKYICLWGVFLEVHNLNNIYTYPKDSQEI